MGACAWPAGFPAALGTQGTSRTHTPSHTFSAPLFRRSPRKPPEDEREIKRDDEIRALPPSEQAVQLRKKRMYLKQRAEEARADAEGTVPILAPEPALAPSFDADVTGYRYRVLEDPSGIIARWALFLGELCRVGRASVQESTCRRTCPSVCSCCVPLCFVGLRARHKPRSPSPVSLPAMPGPSCPTAPWTTRMALTACRWRSR